MPFSESKSLPKNLVADDFVRPAIKQPVLSEYRKKKWLTRFISSILSASILAFSAATIQYATVLRVCGGSGGRVTTVKYKVYQAWSA